MCITRNEMDSVVSEIRSLKALKEETDNAIKALENDLIEYFKTNGVEEVIGSDFKATYKSQERRTLDKKRLEEDLGSLTEYEKVTAYSVLRIK